jgi:hypothetical protein
VLHDIEGWAKREIAGIEDVDLSRIHARVGRARMMLLRSVAEDAEIDVPRPRGDIHCWEVRRDFSDHLDGVLDARDVARIDRHLRRCMPCSNLFASLLTVKEGLGLLRNETIVL